MQELVRGLREVRNRYSIHPTIGLNVCVSCALNVAEDFKALAPFITSLGGVDKLEIGQNLKRPAQAASQLNPDFEAYVSLVGLIDVAKETDRLEKQLAEKLKHLQATRGKLGNASFVERAPADVVQQQRDLVADLQNQIKALEDNLRELKGG